MDQRMSVFITPDALARRIASGEPTSILAVRNAGPQALPGFAATPRIPGAVDADLPSQFASPGGGTLGSRPLPAIGDLQRDARSWGLRRGVPVVLYDHDRCLTAARGCGCCAGPDSARCCCSMAASQPGSRQGCPW